MDDIFYEIIDGRCNVGGPYTESNMVDQCIKIIVMVEMGVEELHPKDVIRFFFNRGWPATKVFSLYSLLDEKAAFAGERIDIEDYIDLVEKATDELPEPTEEEVEKRTELIKSVLTKWEYDFLLEWLSVKKDDKWIDKFIAIVPKEELEEFYKNMDVIHDKICDALKKQLEEEQEENENA